MTVPLKASADAAETAPDAAPSGVGRTAIEGRSLGQIAWMRLRREKVAMAGGIFITFAWPCMGRIIRGQTLSPRKGEFADAAFHLMKRPQWSLSSSGA